MKTESKVWKVEYHSTEWHQRQGIKTTKEFDNFEEARSFCVSVIGNHLGAVRMVHPEEELLSLAPINLMEL